MKKIFILISIFCFFNIKPMEYFKWINDIGSKNTEPEFKPEEFNKKPNQKSNIKSDFDRDLANVKKFCDQLDKNKENEKNNIGVNYQHNSNDINQNVNVSFFGFDFLDQYKKILKKSKDKAKKGFSSAFSWIKNNKKKSLLTLSAITYFGLEARLLYLTKKLKSSNNWSFWRSEKSMEQLYKISQDNFSKMLLTDIQQTYSTISNPTDFVTPLVNFMTDTDKEITYLKEYSFLIRSISKIHLKKLFWYNSAVYEETEKRLNRLYFMKNTFLTWLADYKLNQSSKKRVNN